MKNIILLCCAYLLSIAMHAQGIITTVAGGGTGGDGSLAVNAYISSPNDVYVDDTGNIYIASDYKIRKITAATGIIHTLAGDGNGGVGCDGCDATQARFWGALAIAFDKYGNYYIADNGNAAIRKVDAATNIITIVAGNWTQGYSGDGGPATSAQLSNPIDICFDTAGNMYIADEDYVIRKIDAQTGNISTIAGNGTQGTWSNGDVAVNAQLGGLAGICLDNLGNIYFADFNNHKIGKINTSGVLSTYCGTGIFGNSGDGGLATNAQIIAAGKIRRDKNNNIFLADGTVRKIDAGTGIIDMVAGPGSGFCGDGGPATQACLAGPRSIWIDTIGDFYIADGLNYRIRKVSYTTSISPVVKDFQFRSYPNPSTGRFLIESSKRIDRVEIFNAVGKAILRESVYEMQTNIDLSSQPDGFYAMNVYVENAVMSVKVIIRH